LSYGINPKYNSRSFPTEAAGKHSAQDARLMTSPYLVLDNELFLVFSMLLISQKLISLSQNTQKRFKFL
jgi:hypothetical protein